MPSSASAIAAAVPGLKIPAFSRAMLSGVSPRNSVWSMPIETTPAARGWMTFVASSRPPSPVSMTDTCAPERANQSKASAVVARLTGAEAGFITACASSGITLAVAGCMTGEDLGRIEQLPDTTGMKNEVVIQLGHMVGYGAPVEQAIRLTGASVVPVGQATEVRGYQLTHRLTDRTAAAVYVVSHHTV